MAYSDQEIDRIRNQLLEVSRSSSPSWSAVDDAIYNSFWESNKDKPEVVLNFPIAGQAQAPDEKNKSGSREGPTAKSGGSSPFAVENGVVTYNGKPVSEMTPEELRAGYGRVGSPGTPTMQFTAGSESGGEFTGYSYDPEYWEEYEETVGGGGDEGYATRRAIRLRPEYQQYYEYNPTGVGSENTASPQAGYKPEIAGRLVRDGENWGQVGIPRSFGGELEPIDPSRIVWDEELGYITPASNIRQPTGSVFTPGMLLLAGGMLGAVGMAGGFSGLGSLLGFGEAAAAGAAEGAGAAGALEGAVAGTGATTGATTGGIVSGATETALAGTGAGSAGAGVGAGIGSGGLEVSEAMRNILAQGTAAGGSAASTAANAAIQQGVQTLGGIGGGGWFSNLSPMAQRAITSAVSQGASAVMAGRRQESAQDFARQQQERQYEIRRQEEERAMEERRIRGTPSAFTFNVTPRSGIVGSSMGGG